MCITGRYEGKVVLKSLINVYYRVTGRYEGKVVLKSLINVYYRSLRGEGGAKVPD